MLKFNPSDKWYIKYAERDEKYDEVSAGRHLFPFQPSFQKEENVNNDLEIFKISFHILMRKLRISKEISMENLANQIDLDLIELYRIENEIEYKPSPRTIMQLAKYYDIPYKVLAEIAGAVKNPDKELAENMVKYVAKSCSYEKLTNEEKEQLSAIINVLRNYGKKS